MAAASARPQYGQGMVGGAQMGLMNQQQHQQQPQQQRYDRSVAEGGNRSNASANNRFSRQSNQRPGSGRAATLVRRSDTSSGAVNKVTRTSVSSATLRGNRKRYLKHVYLYSFALMPSYAREKVKSSNLLSLR